MWNAMQGIETVVQMGKNDQDFLMLTLSLILSGIPPESNKFHRIKLYIHTFSA